MKSANRRRITKPKLNPRKLEKMIKEAIIDCHDIDEALIGFANILEDKLEVPFGAKMLGEDVAVVEIREGDNRIVATVEKNTQHHDVDILDLKDIKNAKNAEWIEAYRQWRGSL